MKKILFFIDNLGSGGAQRQIVNLAIMMKHSGYDVRLLVYQDIPFYKFLLDKESIPVDLIECKNIFERIYKVVRYINSGSQDAVISFLEVPGFLSCLAKSLRKSKWKLITNELSAKKSTFTSKRNRIFNIFERYSNYKVCNSFNSLNMWIEYYPQYEEKLKVIYNPVIIKNQFLNRDFSFEHIGKCKLIIAASYQKLKNPLGLIEAVNLLNKDSKKCLAVDWYGRKEVVLGDTRIYDESIRRIKKYNLEGVINLHGECSDIYSKMCEADGVGLFSEVEGLPNAICEGMMLGKPILMSRVSDYDILTNGNGFLCDASSSESIKEAIMSWLNSSPDELGHMGMISLQKANRMFSVEEITKQWINLIEK